MDVAACKASCLELAGCEAIVVPTKKLGWGESCNRRSQVDLARCSTNAGTWSSDYDTYTLAPLPPLPPSVPHPPAPPPRPIHPPSSASVINARFATDAGVLVHLLDSYIFVDGEVSGLSGQGRFGQLGTISATIILQRQRERFGPKIPVYDINDAGRYGGVVIRQEAVHLSCMYGADIGSWGVQGGCQDRNNGWCDEFVDASRDNPCAGLEHPSSYKCKCCTQFSPGCSTSSMPPWRGEHVGVFLDFYLRYGGHPACCGSGYNEVIIQAGDAWNHALPGPIEAFFYDVARKNEDWGKGASAHARRMRDGFVQKWGLTTADVPLLEFDRTNYEWPFEPSAGE